MPRMLSWEEAQRLFWESSALDQEQLERSLSEYMPQGVTAHLIDEVLRYVSAQEGVDDESATQYTSFFMMGFHMGWLVAERVFTE